MSASESTPRVPPEATPGLRRAAAMANLDLLERLIAQSPFDAVIAVSPENVRYAADVHIATQRSIRDRLAWVLWPRGEAPTLIVCEIEAPYARAHTWISDVQGYREFDPGPVRALADGPRLPGSSGQDVCRGGCVNAEQHERDVCGLVAIDVALEQPAA